jgi:enoyl-CoA hydratase/carnithine racemase
MEYSTVIFEKLGHTAMITLNRPERLNSFNDVMTQEFQSLWREISEDDAIWTIVLTGSGRGFCSGADLTPGARNRRTGERPWKRTGPGFGDPGRYLSPKGQRLFKPYIVAVNGICAGGGFYFLNEADILICSSKAQFLEPHTSHGLTAAVEPQGLRWRIGPTWSLRLALMGKHERMDAETAFRIGLVTEVVEPERLRERALEIASIVNKNSPTASHATVESMWRGMDMGRQASLEFAHTMVHHNSMSEGEGRLSFLEKREPDWER